MKTGNYRDVASEIVERYITIREISKELLKDDSYNKGYSDAIQMVLSVLSDKEIAEVENFYRFFSKVF